MQYAICVTAAKDLEVLWPVKLSYQHAETPIFVCPDHQMTLNGVLRCKVQRRLFVTTNGGLDMPISIQGKLW